MTRSVRYQPILHTLYYTLHTEHAYCLSYRFFNNVVITTVIEMVEMVEILDGRLGQRSVERVRYVIGEGSEPLSMVYNDQPRDIYIYKWPMADRTYVSNTHARVRMSI